MISHNSRTVSTLTTLNSRITCQSLLSTSPDEDVRAEETHWCRIIIIVDTPSFWACEQSTALSHSVLFRLGGNFGISRSFRYYWMPMSYIRTDRTIATYSSTTNNAIKCCKIHGAYHPWHQMGSLAPPITPNPLQARYIQTYALMSSTYI